MKLSLLTGYLEEIAPLNYQESYDNSGLLTGNPEMNINNALITLDCTEKVIEEAIKKNCNLIISHHPLIFGGITKLTGSNNVERALIRAIKKNIAIYAIHTNLDNVLCGVNSIIAEKLELCNAKILLPRKHTLKKLFTFCPVDKAEKVRGALFKTGAGEIGKYSECSFNAKGTGTFKASDTANPYVGQRGTRHHEEEIRIEAVFASHLERKILEALFKSHPYEEVAYDIVSLENNHYEVGAGMIGDLNNPMGELHFIKKVKKVMNCKSLQYTDLTGKKVSKVAVCGGSGGYLLNHAIENSADVFITSDIKYHQFFEADGKILIVNIGHYECEQFTKLLIYDLINKKFPKFALHLSEIKTNPINYL